MASGGDSMVSNQHVPSLIHLAPSYFSKYLIALFDFMGFNLILIKSHLLPIVVLYKPCINVFFL